MTKSVIESNAVTQHSAFAVAEPLEVGAQFFAGNERDGLDVRATLSGNLAPGLPVTDDALRHAEAFGEAGNPPGTLDGD